MLLIFTHSRHQELRFIFLITTYKVTAKRSFFFQGYRNFNLYKCDRKHWKFEDYQSDFIVKKNKTKHQGTDKQGNGIKLCCSDAVVILISPHGKKNTVLWKCMTWGKDLWAVECFLPLQCNVNKAPFPKWRKWKQSRFFSRGVTLMQVANHILHKNFWLVSDSV